MTERPPLDRRRAVLAAEYALGIVDPGERAGASRLLREDEQFAAEVARWEDIAGEWLDEASEVPPSPDLWRRIAAGIGGGHDAGAVPSVPTRAPTGWRITALAASIAAIVFAALWVGMPGPVSRQPPIASAPTHLQGLSFARIDGKGEEQLVTAAYERRTGRFVARLSPLATAGRVPELWVIGADGKPKSLGIGQPGQVISIVLPPEARLLFADGATIAISLEAPSDRLHDTPSGPILGTAKISGI